MGRPNKALMISEADRPLVRSQSMPHSLVRRAAMRRAQIVLLSDEGESNWASGAALRGQRSGG